MRWLHVDAAGGLAGDMIVAALIDLGGPLEIAAVIAAKLGLKLQMRPVTRQGLHAHTLQVHDTSATTGDAVSGAMLWQRLHTLGLSVAAETLAQRSLEALLQAEAAVHRQPLDSVHLHETGGCDALFDLAATAELCVCLGIDGASASELPVGPGEITCAHGVLPLPAPATLKLLQGYRLRPAPLGEWVTPTGAALLQGLAARPDLPVGFVLERSGVGAGQRDPKDWPNVLRLWLGHLPADAAFEPIVELAADIDDMTPELLAGACEQLRALGALDVSQAALLMKKQRLGTRILVLVRPDQELCFVDALFAHTTTLGVRRHVLHRHTRPRLETEGSETLGSVRLKTARAGSAKPEYEDCQGLAQRVGLPLKDVMAWIARPKSPGKLR